jgi:hypothetical protein
LESVCGGNSTVGSNPTLSVFLISRSIIIRFGGLCNWSLRTPPGPEGSNGSGYPNVTQLPLSLARRILNEVSSYRPEIQTPGL